MKHSLLIVSALSAAVGLSGCNQFVKRGEYNATVEELRAADLELRAADGDLASQLELMHLQFGELTENLQAKFEDYDANIALLQGRLRVDMTAHFAYDDAAIGEDDKPALLDFSDVIRDHHPNVMVTVEGFTDPAGSAEYNKWLGQQRANSVRDYLVSHGGLNEARVRAVSYGEDTERQIEQGAWGDAGRSNRRVALVIDFVSS